MPTHDNNDTDYIEIFINFYFLSHILPDFSVPFYSVLGKLDTKNFLFYIFGNCQYELERV